MLHPIRRPSAGKLVYIQGTARIAIAKSLGEPGVIQRSNYLLVRRYLLDLEEVYQLSSSSSVATDSTFAICCSGLGRRHFSRQPNSPNISKLRQRIFPAAGR